MFQIKGSWRRLFNPGFGEVIGKLVCFNINASVTQRDNVKSFYQRQVNEKTYTYASMDVFLKDRQCQVTGVPSRAIFFSGLVIKENLT